MGVTTIGVCVGVGVGGIGVSVGVGVGGTVLVGVGVTTMIIGVMVGVLVGMGVGVAWLKPKSRPTNAPQPNIFTVTMVGVVAYQPAGVPAATR